MDVVITLLAVVAAVVIGAFLGYGYRRKVYEAKMTQAEDAVSKMIEEAQKRAEALKKEMLLEAKEEVHGLRDELDKEIKERRNEIQRSERRLVQKEACIDRNPDKIEQTEHKLNDKWNDLEKKQKSIDALFQ